MNDWSLIHAYTRKQALEDWVLVDVSAAAKELGFTIPVAVTGTLYHTYIKPDPDQAKMGQSPEGRLFDTLFVLHSEIKRCLKSADRLEFIVLFQMAEDLTEEVRLIAVIGPGDSFEPVLTIMLPEDD